MNIEEAVGNVKLIKRIIRKTKDDISNIASFFILIGALNILVLIIRIFSIPIIDRLEAISGIVWKVYSYSAVVPFFGTIIIFAFFYLHLRKRENDLSISILKIWGILLIGGKVFAKIFVFITTEGYDISNSTEAGKNFVNSQVFEFVFPVVGFIIMGVIIHEKAIVVLSAVCTGVYMILIKLDIKLQIGKSHGQDVLISSYSFYSILTISVGMILVGLYLKIKRTYNGNKFDSGYITE